MSGLAAVLGSSLLSIDRNPLGFGDTGDGFAIGVKLRALPFGITAPSLIRLRLVETEISPSEKEIWLEGTCDEVSDLGVMEVSVRTNVSLPWF